MKFKRAAKDPILLKSNLKTIDQKGNKKSLVQKKQSKAVIFNLEGKENKSTAKCAVSEALSDRMANGLSLFNAARTMEYMEAKPIAKPVLSFMDGSQNYFKRSFSMRARSSNLTTVTACEQEMKTATIRRAFGKSLTRKRH